MIPKGIDSGIRRYLILLDTSLEGIGSPNPSSNPVGLGAWNLDCIIRFSYAMRLKIAMKYNIQAAILHIRILLVSSLPTEGQKSGLPTFSLTCLRGTRLYLPDMFNNDAAACSTT